jgi:hypothetical protein
VVNTYPENLPRAGYGRPRFVLDLMAVRNLPDVIVKYSILMKAHPELIKPWNETDVTYFNRWELAGNIPLLMETQAWFDRSSRQGLGLSIITAEMQLEYRGSRSRMYIYDYTDAFRALGLGLGQLNTTDTIWAIIVDESSGNVSVFSGIRDFFYNRLRIMYSLEISDGEGTESYASPRMPPELRGEKPSLASGPPLGTTHSKDVTEGDRIHIFFELMAERIFPHEGLIQLVMIETGIEEMMLVNFMGSSSTA